MATTGPMQPLRLVLGGLEHRAVSSSWRSPSRHAENRSQSCHHEPVAHIQCVTAIVTPSATRVKLGRSGGLKQLVQDVVEVTFRMTFR